MKKLFFTLILCLGWTGLTWAHGDISKLPNSVQIMQYRLLLYMNPDDPVARNDLAMALYRTNQSDEAEKELRYLLEKEPENFDALDGLGVVLIKKKRYEDALQYLKKALSLNDQDVMVHVHLSVAYQKTDLPQEAQSALEKARSLAKDPTELENIYKELELVTKP